MHGDVHEKHRSIHPRRHVEQEQQDERPIFRHFPDCERGLCLVAEGIVEPTLESSVPSMGFQQFPSAKSTGNIWELDRSLVEVIPHVGGIPSGLAAIQG